MPGSRSRGPSSTCSGQPATSRSISAPTTTDPVDYPDVIAPAARAVAAGDCDLGIVLGGSGTGRADRGQQDPGHPLRRGGRPGHRAPGPRAQRRQRARDGRPHHRQRGRARPASGPSSRRASWVAGTHGGWTRSAPWNVATPPMRRSPAARVTATRVRRAGACRSSSWAPRRSPQRPSHRPRLRQHVAVVDPCSVLSRRARTDRFRGTGGPDPGRVGASRSASPDELTRARGLLALDVDRPSEPVMRQARPDDGVRRRHAWARPTSRPPRPRLGPPRSRAAWQDPGPQQRPVHVPPGVCRSPAVAASTSPTSTTRRSPGRGRSSSPSTAGRAPQRHGGARRERSRPRAPWSSTSTIAACGRPTPRASRSRSRMSPVRVRYARQYARRYGGDRRPRRARWPLDGRLRGRHGRPGRQHVPESAAAAGRPWACGRRCPMGS